ncbi:hypothetical protein BD414DRAFT_481944 [Trametes punicea]|nr:hypothetical protein BD414DRAFT_481944 [Trametes punicea]
MVPMLVLCAILGRLWPRLVQNFVGAQDAALPRSAHITLGTDQSLLFYALPHEDFDTRYAGSRCTATADDIHTEMTFSWEPRLMLHPGCRAHLQKKSLTVEATGTL